MKPARKDARCHFSRRSGSGDAHGLAEGVAADFEDAEAVHLPDAASIGIDEEQILLDHLADFRFREVVPFDLRVERFADVCSGDYVSATAFRDIGGFARQIGEIEETRGYFAAAAGETNPMLRTPAPVPWGLLRTCSIMLTVRKAARGSRTGLVSGA